MLFHAFTLSAVTAIVVGVSGVLFLIETVVRRDTGAGRIWSLSFLGAILTSLCYLAWAASVEPLAAIAVGNAAFVAATGCMWLGSRSFNGRSIRASAYLVAGGSLAALVAVLIEGPGGGDWAGAVVMFFGLGTFALLGAVETRRGAMARHPTAVGLTLVLVVEGLFFLARIFVFLVSGPDGEVFRTWFDTATASLVTIVLIIVAVVTLSVLRSSAGGQGAAADAGALAVSADGVLLPEFFGRVVADVVDRARQSAERLAVVSLRIDDLAHVATAFGPEEAHDITREWRAGVRRYAPTAALIGETDATELVVCFQPSSIGDARRIASRIHRRVLDDFAAMGSAVIPIVGVGVAMTDSIGYDAPELVRAAGEAATRSASSPDASVIIAGMV